MGLLRTYFATTNQMHGMSGCYPGSVLAVAVHSGVPWRFLPPPWSPPEILRWLAGGAQDEPEE